MSLETEISDLRRRVGDLEGVVKVLAGQLGGGQQAGHVSPELIVLGEATMKRLDVVTALMDRVVNRLDTMNTQVWSLRDDLPVLMADAIARSNKRFD